MPLTSTEINHIAQALRYADLLQIDAEEILTREQMLVRQIELIIKYQTLLNGKQIGVGDELDGFKAFLVDPNIYAQFVRTHQDVLAYHPILKTFSYWETLTPAFQTLLFKKYLEINLNEHLQQKHRRNEIMSALYQNMQLLLFEACPELAFLKGVDQVYSVAIINEFCGHAKRQIRAILFAFEEYKFNYINFLHNWLQKCEVVLGLELRANGGAVNSNSSSYFFRSANQGVNEAFLSLTNYEDLSSLPLDYLSNSSVLIVCQIANIGHLIETFKQRFGVSSEILELSQSGVNHAFALDQN